MTPVEAFRDLFVLNQNVQNQLKSASTPDAFITQTVRLAQSEYDLFFTEDELRAAIKNYAETLEGEAPACVVMGRLSPLRKAGKLPDMTPDSVNNLVQFTIEFLNSDKDGEGPGVCKW